MTRYEHRARTYNTVSRVPLVIIVTYYNANASFCYEGRLIPQSHQSLFNATMKLFPKTPVAVIEEEEEEECVISLLVQVSDDDRTRYC